MVSTALIVSPDEGLATELQKRIAALPNWDATLVASCQESKLQLCQHRLQAVVLDLRAEIFEPEAQQLLNWMASHENGDTRILAIAEQGYRRSLVPLVDLVVTGHLSLPVDQRRFAELLNPTSLMM